MSASFFAASSVFFLASAAFAASTGAGGSFAQTAPAVVAIATLNIRIRTLMASPSSSMLNLRRGRLAGGRRGLDLPGSYVVVPVLVVLLRPGLVHVAVAHRLVGAFQTDRAEVDVSERNRHHRAGSNGVDHVRLDHDRGERGPRRCCRRGD